MRACKRVHSIAWNRLQVKREGGSVRAVAKSRSSHPQMRTVPSRGRAASEDAALRVGGSRFLRLSSDFPTALRKREHPQARRATFGRPRRLGVPCGATRFFVAALLRNLPAPCHSDRREESRSRHGRPRFGRNRSAPPWGEILRPSALPRRGPCGQDDRLGMHLPSNLMRKFLCLHIPSSDGMAILRMTCTVVILNQSQGETRRAYGTYHVDLTLVSG
jgi:hypothetical protein